jgi:hypothetical protein
MNDPTYENLIKSVSAIIFLSTPHRGTNLADTLNRIPQVSFVSSPMQLIVELSVGSQTTQKLNEQFRHVALGFRLCLSTKHDQQPYLRTRKWQVAFMASQYNLTMSPMVLEKDSSVLGYPGEISKPLDANHHGVCKNDSPDYPC